MFQITVSKGLFGPKVLGQGKCVLINARCVAVHMTVNNNSIAFMLAMESTGLLRSLERGGKVTHKENGMHYTFSPVYA